MYTMIIFTIIKKHYLNVFSSDLIIHWCWFSRYLNHNSSSLLLYLRLLFILQFALLSSFKNKIKVREWNLDYQILKF